MIPVHQMSIIHGKYMININKIINSLDSVTNNGFCTSSFNGFWTGLCLFLGWTHVCAASYTCLFLYFYVFMESQEKLCIRF